jgi:hypothetical protein
MVLLVVTRCVIANACVDEFENDKSGVWRYARVFRGEFWSFHQHFRVRKKNRSIPRINHCGAKNRAGDRGRFFLRIYT